MDPFVLLLGLLAASGKSIRRLHSNFLRMGGRLTLKAINTERQFVIDSGFLNIINKSVEESIV